MRLLKPVIALLFLVAMLVGGGTLRQSEPPQEPELFPDEDLPQPLSEPRQRPELFPQGDLPEPPSEPPQEHGGLHGEYLPPFLRAAFFGRLDEVRSMLEAGVQADQKDEELGGLTALMMAAYNGHLEVIKLLLKSGADPNASGGIAHVGFFTPLAMALNPANKNRLEVIDTLIAGGAQLNPPASFDDSPLCQAVVQNDIGMIKALLARGSDVNWESEWGTTPLGDAVTNGNATVAVVDLLLKAGADPNKPRLWDQEDCLSLLEHIDRELKMSRELKMPRNRVREEIRRLIVQHGGKKIKSPSHGMPPCKR